MAHSIHLECKIQYVIKYILIQTKADHENVIILAIA